MVSGLAISEMDYKISGSQTLRYTAVSVFPAASTPSWNVFNNLLALQNIHEYNRSLLVISNYKSKKTIHFNIAYMIVFRIFSKNIFRKWKNKEIFGLFRQRELCNDWTKMRQIKKTVYEMLQSLSRGNNRTRFSASLECRRYV